MELRWTGRYVEALSRHEQKGRYGRHRLEKWRKALSDVSYIIGFELEAYNGDEGELLENVVRCVLRKGRNIGSTVSRYPTGFEEKIEDFEISVLLQHRQNGKVKVLGSLGMGGLNEVSRARNVFNGESSNTGHGQVEKGTPISNDPEKVIFQRQALLAATENFHDDKGCDAVIFERGEGNIAGSHRETLLAAPENFHDQRGCDDVVVEGGEGNIKSSTLGAKGLRAFRLNGWKRRLIQRCNLNPLGGTGMIQKSAECLVFSESDEAVRFKMNALIIATNNFHEDNKIGRGGFGAVYKGITRDGQEFAVKKLSELSSQGKEEFLTEVKLLTKIQHGNLVKLLGYCTEGSELMIVYEYLPNKSLDRILFDPNKRQKLNWQMRYNIILGIARGLSHLHEECKPQIIHRDIKASNILLDHEFNPKITDLGLAKVLPENDTYITTRVAGTMGYIAPEYLLGGQVSVKADVYSFGLLLLELIAGRLNVHFNVPEEKMYLLELAWRSYRKGEVEQMIDPSIIKNCDMQQAERCIHVALLCTQDDSSLRPPMSTTTLMLSNPSVELPYPKPNYILGNRVSP